MTIARRWTGITADSREVRQGYLFAAVPGVNVDGWKYAADAVKAGAAAILAQESAPETFEGVPVIRVPSVRRALAEQAAAFYDYPADKLQIYGVTGTNGKTTTAWIVSEMLKAAGKKVGLITTVKTEYPGFSGTSEQTTPDAVTLQRTLAKMVEAGCECVVMEISSHAVDQSRVFGIKFTALGFTNLTQDHLDYHHTMEAYYLAKKRLFEENPQALSVANICDTYGARLAMEVGATPYTVHDAVALEMTADGAAFNFRGEHLTTGLTGKYNIDNILCALAMTRKGVPLEKAYEAIRNLKPRWGRLERVQTLSHGAVFVDYAHTDDALTHVLAALRPLTKRRLICVFGCGGDRDRTKRSKMAAAVAQGADAAVVTSDNPRSEHPDSILAEICASMPPGFAYEVIADRRKAIYKALDLAHPGDTILIAGKGHETYQEIKGVKHLFDDRQVAGAFEPKG